MPNFWRVPLPGERSNPGSRQDIYRFPDSRNVFWSNPGSLEYPFRPWVLWSDLVSQGGASRRDKAHCTVPPWTEMSKKNDYETMKLSTF